MRRLFCQSLTQYVILIMMNLWIFLVMIACKFGSTKNGNKHQSSHTNQVFGNKATTYKKKNYWKHHHVYTDPSTKDLKQSKSIREFYWYSSMSCTRSWRSFKVWLLSIFPSNIFIRNLQLIILRSDHTHEMRWQTLLCITFLTSIQLNVSFNHITFGSTVARRCVP